MKICLIVDDYLPASKKSAAKAMHDLAVEFIERGHSVTVVTPNQSSTKQKNIFVLDGVTVCEFRSGRTKSASKSFRLINESLFSARAWIAFKAYFKVNRHDLIVYHSPSIFWGSLVMFLKQSWGARSYLILRDLFPQWVIDQGMISAVSPIAYYFRLFENISYSAADVIGVQSPKNRDWFALTKKSSRPVEVLFNWIISEPKKEPCNLYRQSLGLEGKVIFFYGGNIGPAQDMLNIVVLAKMMMRYNEVRFLMVGSGSEYELVKVKIKEEGVANLLLLPAIDQCEYRKMLAEIDVGLFSLHRAHTTHNFPGKLLEYMNQSKPILGCVNPDNDLKPIIESAKAGLISISGDHEVLFNNAVRLLKDSELRKRFGENGKLLLDKVFSVKKAAEQILAASSRFSVQERGLASKE